MGNFCRLLALAAILFCGLAATSSQAKPITKEELLEFVRIEMKGQPFDAARDAKLHNIQEYIKAFGVDFVLTQNYENELGEIMGASTVVTFAIKDNYGPPPSINELVGTFLLTTLNRGDPLIRDVYESVLEIHPDGTYVWSLPKNVVFAGAWREALAKEMHPSEAGPTVVLVKAMDAVDHFVKVARVASPTGWIDVGMLDGYITTRHGVRY